LHVAYRNLDWCHNKIKLDRIAITALRFLTSLEVRKPIFYYSVYQKQLYSPNFPVGIYRGLKEEKESCIGCNPKPVDLILTLLLFIDY